MSIRNNIKTVVIETLNIETGDRSTPVYEAYGAEGFQKFVDFYASHSGAFVAWVKGYDYNDEHGNPRICAEVFVNANGDVVDLRPEPVFTSGI